MAELDTQFEHFTPQSLEQDSLLATTVTDEMSDHDMMMHHVSQSDAGLYALDCCLADILGA